VRLSASEPGATGEFIDSGPGGETARMPVNVSSGLLSKTLHWGLLASPTFTKPSCTCAVRPETVSSKVPGSATPMSSA
jgi:hypothetical protein